ncbi:hypothetical protein PUN28_020841 [Cardiocondyla obscurior]|uniref:Uncharacterized protein n=1 Tax=Cardiocondyla obscurior TaxID=286306 RepID=A0AAW2E979_9HYME
METDCRTSTKNSENSKIVIQLKLLPHLLPPKGRVYLKKQHWKPSIIECKDSLIVHITILGDITKIQENRRAAAANIGTTLQPYVIAVGPTLAKSNEFFLAVDTTIYKILSALEAIDICYKIYHVFDLEYPVESAHLWLLMQRELYHYSNDVDKLTPYVTETISDLRTLENTNA